MQGTLTKLSDTRWTYTTGKARWSIRLLPCGEYQCDDGGGRVETYQAADVQDVVAYLHGYPAPGTVYAPPPTTAPKVMSGPPPSPAPSPAPSPPANPASCQGAPALTAASKVWHLGVVLNTGMTHRVENTGPGGYQVWTSLQDLVEEADRWYGWSSIMMILACTSMPAGVAVVHQSVYQLVDMQTVMPARLAGGRSTP